MSSKCPAGTSSAERPVEVPGDFWPNHSAEPWGQKPEGRGWGIVQIAPFQEKGGAEASGLNKSFFLSRETGTHGGEEAGGPFDLQTALALYPPAFPLSFFSFPVLQPHFHVPQSSARAFLTLLVFFDRSFWLTLTLPLALTSGDSAGLPAGSALPGSCLFSLLAGAGWVGADSLLENSSPHLPPLPGPGFLLNAAGKGPYKHRGPLPHW